VSSPLSHKGTSTFFIPIIILQTVDN
jgi:hypothetical protein